ncbi:MAG TPA: hypothetical protein VEC01_16745 [Noviherbaspirillum sp.]|uniref:hypothetical protein n=1 Tax=Noviherbaspirillum sp. TaxID=1926288 RepID=UPI002D696A5E|nr:hypothetical protein [Noviherbaspirillum sp.]HYD96979.1 hypothetical protein [Noviherbaspirillum sp.]
MPDPSLFLPLVLQSAVVPFCVALAVMFALRRALSGVAPAAALAAAFIAAYFAVFHAQWSLVPHTALDWMPHIALFGMAGALAAESAPGAAARVFARLVMVLVAATVIVWPALASLGAAKAVLVTGIAAVLVTGAWSWLAQASISRPTPAPLLMVTAGGSALVLMLDASAALGQATGALASALAACVLFNLPRARAAFSPAASGVAVLLLGTLLLNAWLYAGLSAGYVALLAGGLLSDPLVATANRMRGRSGGAGSWITASVLTALPVLATVAFAVKTMQESGGY